MILLLTYITIAGCFIAALTYPALNGRIAGVCVSCAAIAPSAFSITGAAYFPVSAMSLLVGLIFLDAMGGTWYISRLKRWLLVGVVVELVGVLAWYFYLGIHLNNAIYDIAGFSMIKLFGAVYLYELMALSYNLIMLYLIVDWRGRKSVNRTRILRPGSHSYVSSSLRSKNNHT